MPKIKRPIPEYPQMSPVAKFFLQEFDCLSMLDKLLVLDVIVRDYNSYVKFAYLDEAQKIGWAKHYGDLARTYFNDKSVTK